jgi:hypothetical protein
MMKVLVALALFELLLPTAELDHKLHQWEHISRNLPCWWYACWSLERSMRFVTSHVINKAKPTASAAAKIAQSMGSRYLHSPSVTNYSKPYDTHMLQDFNRQVVICFEHAILLRV